MDVQHTSSQRPIRQAACRHNYALLNSKGFVKTIASKMAKSSEISGLASDSSTSYQTAAMCQETLTDNDQEKIGGNKAPLYNHTATKDVQKKRKIFSCG